MTGATEPTGTPVLAAGGVVTRERPGGTEVLIVHRPRYDDWSIPKGKLDIGESDEDAALREVSEETGVLGALVRELATIRYDDHRGRPKRVRYWQMRVVAEHRIGPTEEVDEARWVPIGEAPALLSYEHDKELLDLLVAP